MPPRRNRFFDNRKSPPLDSADITKLLGEKTGGGMKVFRDPDAEARNVSSAMDIVSKVAAAVFMMVVPGVIGQKLDQRWDTGYLALLGFLFGNLFGFYYLITISGPFPGRKGKSPDRPSPSDLPPADNASDDSPTKRPPA